MYKRDSNRWFKHIDFIIIDILCLQVSLWIAYAFRHGVVLRGEALRPYVILGMVLAVIDLLVSIMNATFKNVLKRGKFVEFMATIKHVLLVVAVGIVYIFTVKEGEVYSRAVAYYLVGVYFFISYFVRLSWKFNLLRQNVGQGERSLLIVTYQHLLEDTLDAVMDKNYEKFHLAGLCLLDADRAGERIHEMSIVANMDTVVEFIRTQWVDEVLFRIPMTEEYPKRLIDELNKMGVVTHYTVMDNGEEDGPKHFIGRVGRFSVVTTSINYMSPEQVFGKRVIDILGGIVGCFLMVLAMIVVAPAIKILSPGPIFFSQERVGKNGKKFKMYKFRSMYLDAEERKKELLEKNRISGNLMFKLEDDPRIIGNKLQPDGTMKKGFGHYLRSWSIDELPQFVNVLKGDMSLVGTRPPTVDEWEKYELHHRARLSIKPGLTGMWQVNGRSKVIDFEEVVKLDTAYICDWSFGLDLKILVKTILVVLGKEGSM